MPSQHSVFSPVGREVESRTGYEVKWQRSAMEDGATRDAIEKILAEPLTVDGAVKIALTNNAALQAEFENVGIGLGDVASASLLRNPELDAELRVPIDGGGSALDLGLKQDVLSLFSLGPRRQAAFSDLKAARLRAAGAAIDLIGEVRMAVYRAQADLQLLALRQLTTDAASADFELTQRLREAGNVDLLTLAQHELLLHEAKLNLARAELKVVTGRESLHTLLGLSGDHTAWNLDAPLEPLPEATFNTADLESVAIRESLEMAATRWTMKSLAADIGIARLEAWLPHVAIGASAEREPTGDWAVGPAISLAVPIFDRRQGARASGHAKLRQAQHRYTDLAIQVRADARAASAVLVAARAQVVYLDTVVLPLRERVLDETLKLYNAMSLGPYQLLQAKREEVASRADSIEALYQYWSAHLAVEAISQGRMRGVMNAQPAEAMKNSDAPGRGH